MKYPVWVSWDEDGSYTETVDTPNNNLFLVDVIIGNGLTIIRQIHFPNQRKEVCYESYLEH